MSGATEPFSVDALSLRLDGRSATGFVSYGVTDKLAIGASVPIAHVRFWGQRTRTVAGQSTVQSVQSGSATGLGDISLQARYIVAGHSPRGVSVGGDLRLPTGRADDLLGSGETAARGIVSARGKKTGWRSTRTPVSGSAAPRARSSGARRRRSRPHRARPSWPRSWDAGCRS